MDIEKLVENRARALCRKRWAECGFSEREITGKVDRTWTEWKSDARAVLAIALAAAAEEARVWGRRTGAACNAANAILALIEPKGGDRV